MKPEMSVRPSADCETFAATRSSFMGLDGIAELNTSDLGHYPPRAICVVLTKTDVAPHPMANCFRGMLDLILATNVNAACFPKRAQEEN